MQKLIGLGVGAMVLSLIGCGGSPKNEVAIDKASFDGKWALAVDSGSIGCDNNAVYMTASDGKTYALNGKAKTRSESNGKGWIAVEPDNPVWLDDPNNKGAKIDIGDMIAVGLKLCS